MKKLLAGYEKAARSARNSFSRRNCFCAAIRRAICFCAKILSKPILPRSRKRRKKSARFRCASATLTAILEKPGRALRNSAAVLQNGKIIWRTHKCLLPTYDVFDEDRYFEPAKKTGPFVFNGKKIGITICEDIWNDEDFWPERFYRRDPVKELISQGAEMILNISASPWHDGKEKMRLEMLRRVARDEKIPLAQVNLVGANDELIFDGHSVALDSRGEVIALGKGFAEEIFVAELGESGKRKAESGNDFPPREAQIFSALSLGIRDYVRKCGFKSVIVGLSGGIDSALVAVLAADALGAENVLGVSMPARYSSEGSLSDAAALAKNLGIRYEVLPIEPVFNSRRKAVGKSFCRNEAERGGGKCAVAAARRDVDGAVEQIRRAGVDDRQQIGDGGRLLHALRRHERRAGAAGGRFEDGHLQNRALGQPRENYHSAKFNFKAAERGIAAKPDGSGFVAAL